MRHLAAALAFVILGGCTTTLEVNHLTDSDRPPQNGVAYFLPFTQFELTVSRTLERCPQDGGSFEYKTQVTVVSTTSQPDPAQEYAMDLTTLSNWWKTSDLKLTFMSGGLLQSFNATAADQTGPIVQSALSGIGQIVTTIATDGLIGSDTTQGTSSAAEGQAGAKSVAAPSCNEDTLKALNPHIRKRLDDALDAATDKLNADSAALKALVAAAPAFGARLDSATQKRVLGAVDLVNRDIAVQTASQKPVSNYQKILTVSRTFRWPTSGTLDTPKPVAKTGDTAAIISVAQQVALPGELEALQGWATENSVQATRFPFETSIRLQRLPLSEVVPPGSDPAGSSGIRFRVPARGQLLLCNSRRLQNADHGTKGRLMDKENKHTLPTCDNQSIPPTLPATTAAIWEGNVPQLGRINFLPYQNRAFQSNVLSATFNSDGTLASAEYAEPASEGVSASTAFSSAATTATGTVDAITNASTTRLNAKLAKVQALNNVTAAEATASGSAQANQLAQIQTANNLITAQAAQATATQVAQATANTALLNALAAQDNAQTALKSAQAALTQ